MSRFLNSRCAGKSSDEIASKRESLLAFEPAEIRQARELAGLSQTIAANLIYRTLRNWQQWEGGERKMDPALWELFHIKAALHNVRTDFLRSIAEIGYPKKKAERESNI